MKLDRIKEVLIDTADGNPFGYKFSAMITDDHHKVWVTNRVLVDSDPTAHAEIEAIRGAARAGLDLKECIIYASGEPCPMCLTAIAWAGIKEVYYARGFDEADENNDFYDRPSQETNDFLKLGLTIRRMK